MSPTITAHAPGNVVVLGGLPSSRLRLLQARAKRKEGRDDESAGEEDEDGLRLLLIGRLGVGGRVSLGAGGGLTLRHSQTVQAAATGAPGSVLGGTRSSRTAASRR